MNDMSCHVIEGEEHFVAGGINNLDMRESLFNKIAKKEPSFANLSNRDKFIYLMLCNDSQILTRFGKLLHNSFQTRNSRTILRSYFILCKVIFLACFRFVSCYHCI